MPRIDQDPVETVKSYGSVPTAVFNHPAFAAVAIFRRSGHSVKRATAELSRVGLGMRYSGLVVECGDKLKSIGVAMPKIPEAVRASEVVAAVLGAANDSAARKILKQYGIVWTNPIS